MSESLGMKAVSRVADTDRFPFLKALAHIAVADESVSLNEKKMVMTYSDAWNLGDDAEAAVRDILRSGSGLSLEDVVADFSESGTRYLLVQELMRLSHADGTYGTAERKEIARIARRLDMTENQFLEIEKWMDRGQAWGAADMEDGGDDAPGTDDLEEVMNRDDGSEHDLSDIETGDSDLSDIGTDE